MHLCSISQIRIHKNNRKGMSRSNTATERVDASHMLNNNYQSILSAENQIVLGKYKNLEDWSSNYAE
jgi:hypothetical protein